MVSVSKGMCHILFFSTLKQFGAVVQKKFYSNVTKTFPVFFYERVFRKPVELEIKGQKLIFLYLYGLCYLT